MARLKTEELEARIVACEERIAGLNARYAQPEVFQNAGKLAEIRAELDAVRRDLADLEREYASRSN